MMNTTYGNYPTPVINQQQYEDPYNKYQQIRQPQPVNNYNQGMNPYLAPQIPPRVFNVVQGELAANIYPVEIDQEVTLFDLDGPFAYRRSRDKNGKLSPLEKYRLVLEEDKPVTQVDMKDYPKIDEILDIITDAVQKEVEKKLSEISFKPSSSEEKKERK